MDKEGQGKDKVHNFVDALQITLFIAIFVFIYFLTSPQAQPCFHHWLTVTLWSAWRVGRRPDNSSAAVLCFDDVFCCFPISAFSICLQSRIFARKYVKKTSLCDRKSWCFCLLSSRSPTTKKPILQQLRKKRESKNISIIYP